MSKSEEYSDIPGTYLFDKHACAKGYNLNNFCMSLMKDENRKAFLADELGTPYQEYQRAVPRLVPRLRSSLPRTRGKPQWLRAVLSEFGPIGVFLALAVFSWSYDIQLMEKVILVCFGVSLVARAFMLGAGKQATPGK